MKTYVVTFDSDENGLEKIYGATVSLDEAKGIALAHLHDLDDGEYFVIYEYEGEANIMLGWYDHSGKYTTFNLRMKNISK